MAASRLWVPAWAASVVDGTEIVTPRGRTTAGQQREVAGFVGHDGGRRTVWARRASLALYLSVLLVIGARTSLWGDEGFTAQMVRQPWHLMARDLTHIDVNMALYYSLVKLVCTVPGYGEVWLRLVSAVSVAACVPVVARLARQLLGHRSGLLAALLFAINPFTVLLGATARSYALLMLGAAATTVALLRAVESASFTRWLVWAGLSAALLYIHLLATLLIAAQMVFVAAHVIGSVRARGRPVRFTDVSAPIFAVALVGLAFVPTAVFLAPSDTLNWVGPASLHQGASALIRALGGPAVAAALLILATVGLARTARRRPKAAWGLLVAWLAVPAGAILALLPMQSLLVDEYLSVFLIPVCLAAAHGVGAVPRRWRWGVALIVPVLAVGTAGLRTHTGWQVTQQDWRAADARLAAAAGSGDAVGFPNAFYRNVAEYYDSPSAVTGLTATRPVLPAAPWGSLRPYQLDRLKRLGLQATPDAVLAQTNGLRSVWLVGPEDDLLDTAVTTLTAHGFHVAQTLHGPGLMLVQVRN